jgi:membrane associated rhomboid family serine protease
MRARLNKQVRSASARVTGSHASARLQRTKTFTLTDHFLEPIAALAAELNAARAQAVGVDASAPVAAAAPEESPIGLAEFKLPWVTFALLIILVAVFTFENMFPLAPGKELAPSIRTLFGMGPLSRTAVLSGGEWYRLFTAPLLHANFAHIAGNSVALLLGGWLLERLIGRLWFFAFFVIGALGGSLMSLAVGPQNLVSVGASGALMGLFAALFIGGFRVPAGTAIRTRLQVNSMRILIPSLLPIFSSSSVGHMDYGAHFGGAIAGAAAAQVLAKNCAHSAGSDSRRRHCHRRRAPVCRQRRFRRRQLSEIRHRHHPSSRISGLDRRPPGARGNPRRAPSAGPRAHLYLSGAVAAAKDDVGAERELRLALTQAQTYEAIFGAQFKDVMARAGAFPGRARAAGRSHGPGAPDVHCHPGRQGRRESAEAIDRPTSLRLNGRVGRFLAGALFRPRLEEDDLPVHENEICLADEDDGVLARERRIGCGRVEILIAVDAPSAMGDVRLGREHRPGAVGPIEIIVPRRFPLADSKRGQCFAVGILRRRMLLDLGIDRLPGVGFGVGGLVAQPVKTGDVIRTRRFAGFGNARIVALGGCERMKVASARRRRRDSRGRANQSSRKNENEHDAQQG